MSKTFPARLFVTVVSLAILTFMGIFSETSLAIISPHLMEEFHVSAVAVQWLTSGFLLLLAAAIPLSPFLVKTVSTKLLFRFAVIVFGCICKQLYNAAFRQAYYGNRYRLFSAIAYKYCA